MTDNTSVTIAIAIVPAVITGVLSAIVTSLLSFDRSKKEKIWQERLSRYQQILDDLHDMGVGFDNMLAASEHEKDISEEDRKEFKERYFKGRRSIERFVYTSDLLLHRSVRPRLQKLFADIDTAGFTNSWVVYLDDSSGAIQSCARYIIATARRHLES